MQKSKSPTVTAAPYRRRFRLRISTLLLSLIAIASIAIGVGIVVRFIARHVAVGSVPVSATTSTISLPFKTRVLYTAGAPGPCDTPGKSHWFAGTATATQCVAGHLRLTMQQPHVTSTEGFRYPGTLPKNYAVQVTINNLTSAACGGTFLRVTNTGAYYFAVCANGTWSIQKYSAGRSISTLAHGSMRQSSTYTIVASVNGSHLGLIINGVVATAPTDTAFSATDHITLDVSATNSTKQSIDFFDFSLLAIE